MTAHLRLIPALALGGLLATACGPGQHGAVDGTPRPPTPTPAAPTPTATPADTGALVAVLDHPFGAAPNSLRLLRPDGTEAARVALDPDAEAVATSGSLVLVAGAGTLHAYSRDGSTAGQVGLPGDASTSLVRGLIGDATGAHWLWSSVVQSSGTAVSSVYAGGGSAAPALLVKRSQGGTALQPVAWTAGGPVVSEEPLGIGGYVLFRRTFGAASRIDPGTGAVSALTAGDCAFSDMAADGTVACVVDGREGPRHGSGPVTLRILHPGHAATTVTLPAGMAQAGAAFFSADGSTLSLAMSPALGEGQEQIETDLVDVATGTRHAFGPAGLIPNAWMPDGSLLAVRLPGVGGGDAGTYVVAHDGTATLLSLATTVVGVLR
ncbi:MAG TPA: hypothetical protein VGQ42_16900 [Candidatus Dormibacteraeota bacterium]|nr:hypothetical protein [Candidatus Dormibacteraeota bacterium]